VQVFIKIFHMLDSVLSPSTPARLGIDAAYFSIVIWIWHLRKVSYIWIHCYWFYGAIFKYVDKTCYILSCLPIYYRFSFFVDDNTCCLLGVWGFVSKRPRRWCVLIVLIVGDKHHDVFVCDHVHPQYRKTCFSILLPYKKTKCLQLVHKKH